MTDPNVIWPSDVDFELVVWLILVKGENFTDARRIARAIGNQD